MAKKKSLKTALIMAILSITVCISMFAGTTFAWFTDSVTSSGNIIASGKLDVSMSWASGKADPDSATWNDASQTKIFNYDKWEPGYIDAKHIEISNDGTLAFKYKVDIVPNGDIGKLADVIDVYYADPAKAVTRENIESLDNIGTLSSVIANIGSELSTASGNLPAGEKHVITLALRMKPTAGNEYQNLSVGNGFSVRLTATQLAYEEDSFDNQYDANAPLDFVMVSNANELKTALANKEKNIILSKNITDLAEKLTVDYNANINGGGNTISRAAGFTDTMINVADATTLTVENVVLDGGAVWSGEYADANNGGITATGSLIATSGNGNLVLNKDAILQNNAGASAVSLNTRGGGTLTLNGAQIINNSAAGGGAIWGGSNIVINEGSKINGNYASSIGGAIRMVNGYNNITFTMNGGEMNHNTSAGNGGAIWGGNNAKYVFNGGEMAYNSASAGGAIWTGTYETYVISGDFEMHDNNADILGGAIRFCDHASLLMNGGKVYNNYVAGNEDAFYLNNNSANIEDGEIEDNFSYSGGLGLKIGLAEIEGVISLYLSTNHNTAYLMSEFNGFKFIVNEGNANFAQFNFKPDAGYVYTEGDEDKLVCMNAGYETYWDTATSTFRLKAI